MATDPNWLELGFNWNLKKSPQLVKSLWLKKEVEYNLLVSEGLSVMVKEWSEKERVCHQQGHPVKF